jgi:WD40 repeat protein
VSGGAGVPIVLAGHRGAVESAAWSPDGQRIVTASRDLTARVWSIGVPALREALRDATTDCLAPELRATYFETEGADAACGR